MFLTRRTIANACWVLFLLSMFFIVPVFAQNGVQPTVPADSTVKVTTLSAQDMLVNIASQIPNLMRLVTAIAYVLGFYFVFFGLLKLKQFGEARSQMSYDRHLKEPLIYLVIGALLIYLPSAVQVGLSTFWTNPNPYGYDVGEADQWTQFINICYLIVQFIGTVAFIRGLVILTHLAGHGGQQGVFAKGMTHIIGGILCINIYQFVQVIMITLGIKTY